MSKNPLDIEFPSQQIVPCTIDRDDLGPRRNQLHRGLHLFDRSEGVFRAVHEERRCTQRREVACPQLRRLAGRMQRVREKQQCLRQFRRFRREYRCLTSPIGMTAKDHVPGHQFPYLGHRVPQTFPILGTRGWRWWPEASALPERQIATQHEPASRAKRRGHNDQQRRIAVAARAVSEHKTRPAGLFRAMKKSAD